MDIDYKRLIEAALFMSPSAMSLDDLARETGIASVGTIESMLSELVERYKASETALEIVRIDNKYMFGLKEPYASKVSRLASGPDISRGALRILAYVSKNNEAVQSDVVKSFGESTYENVKELIEKGFVETKKYKRSKKLSVTNKFREYFNA